MEPPRYAVTVPYYSNPAYLRATLDSVVAQTDAAWCCIVVDDSPDASAASVVAAIADDRVTLERNDVTLGVAGNFNRCVELGAASGADVGVILHADDLLEPDYVAVLRAAHDRHQHAAAIAPRVTVIDAEGAVHLPAPDRLKGWLHPRRLDRLEGERGLRLLLRGQFFYCPAVSYRWELLPTPAWDAQWTQVMDLMLYGRLLASGGTIHLERARVFRYRRHDASVTQQNSVSLSRTEEEIAACRELARLAHDLGWTSARRSGRIRLSVRLQAVAQAVNSVRSSRFRIARRAAWLALRP